MAINPMVLASLLRTAPVLLKAIQGNTGEIPGVENALNSGYDPVNMENVLKHYMNNNPHPESMSALDYVDSIYGADAYDGPKAFPSDGAENGLSNLFRTLNPDQWKYVGGPQAALSAATFENTPMPDDEFLTGFDNTPHPTGDPTYASHLGELLHDTDGSQDEDARKAYLEWFKTHGYR